MLRGSFLYPHHESLVGFLEAKPVRVGGPARPAFSGCSLMLVTLSQQQFIKITMEVFLLVDTSSSVCSS